LNANECITNSKVLELNAQYLPVVIHDKAFWSNFDCEFRRYYRAGPTATSLWPTTLPLHQSTCVL